jgi:hypothetical protein
MQLNDDERKVLRTLARRGAMSPSLVSAETLLLPGQTLRLLKELADVGMVLLRDDPASADGQRTLNAPLRPAFIQRTSPITGITGPGAIPPSQPTPQQERRGPLVLLVLGLCIVVVLLLLLTDKLPPGIAALPGYLPHVAPYCIVALIGAVVGLAEIASTFLNYPCEALPTRWGVMEHSVFLRGPS